MPISDIPILSMLRTRMQWHQERQRLLSENVANADTQDFRPRDLAPLDLQHPKTALASVGLARTDAGHATGMAGGNSHFEADRRGPFQIRPAGNAVNLEDEMLKVAGNQMDYQAATALYGRTLGLVKTALGKR
jgi:flagellar basal-body rod protein FlgB